MPEERLKHHGRPRIRHVRDRREFDSFDDDFMTQGYQVLNEGQSYALDAQEHVGLLGLHILVAIFTVWWTLGIGNAIYALIADYRRRAGAGEDRSSRCTQRRSTALSWPDEPCRRKASSQPSGELLGVSGHQPGRFGSGTGIGPTSRLSSRPSRTVGGPLFILVAAAGPRAVVRDLEVMPIGLGVPGDERGADRDHLTASPARMSRRDRRATHRCHAWLDTLETRGRQEAGGGPALPRSPTLRLSLACLPPMVVPALETRGPVAGDGAGALNPM